MYKSFPTPILSTSQLIIIQQQTNKVNIMIVVNQAGTSMAQALFPVACNAMQATCCTKPVTASRPTTMRAWKKAVTLLRLLHTTDAHILCILEDRCIMHVKDNSG